MLKLQHISVLLYVTGWIWNTQAPNLDVRVDDHHDRHLTSLDFLPVRPMCSQPFHHTLIQASIYELDILNIFLCKHMQIPMLIFLMKFSFPTLYMDVILFSCSSLENYGSQRYSSLGIFLCIPRMNSICDPFIHSYTY